jgi:L-ascorbate metabolism protein UlaG (beta-lactamase superfamily)
VLEGAGLRGPLYLSGDTVMYRGVEEVGRRFDVDVALLHLGGVRFPISGPARYTMTARAARRAIESLQPRLTVPIHFEGWSHFREPEAAARAELGDSVTWPRRGETLELG